MIQFIKKIWKEIVSTETPKNFQTYAGFDGPIVIIGRDLPSTDTIKKDKKIDYPNLEK
jgi:hypothetical protein